MVGVPSHILAHFVRFDAETLVEFVQRDEHLGHELVIGIVHGLADLLHGRVERLSAQRIHAENIAVADNQRLLGRLDLLDLLIRNGLVDFCGLAFTDDLTDLVAIHVRGFLSHGVGTGHHRDAIARCDVGTNDGRDGRRDTECRRNIAWRHALDELHTIDLLAIMLHLVFEQHVIGVQRVFRRIDRYNERARYGASGKNGSRVPTDERRRLAKNIHESSFAKRKA